MATPEQKAMLIRRLEELRRLKIQLENVSDDGELINVILEDIADALKSASAACKKARS